MYTLVLATEASHSVRHERAQEMNITRKKLMRRAKEQRAEKIVAFMMRVDGLDVNRLVWGDETSHDRRCSYRTHGRALRGSRARGEDWFNRGERLSALGMFQRLKRHLIALPRH